MNKKQFVKLLERVPREERFHASVYAYNTLFLGPEFAMRRAMMEFDFWRRISKELARLQAEHMRNYLRNGPGKLRHGTKGKRA